jgi:hypothetical protein
MINSSTEAWNRLSLFLSRDILKRRYRERHGGELSTAKAMEIISHLDQARQYFLSAESAGVLAGPLEQYYGVLAFSRAIILYLNTSLRETSLKPGHGLRASLPGDGCVEEIQLEVQGGTFDELLNASRNAELASWDEPRPGLITIQQQVVRTLTRPPVDGKFSLIDLLSRIPDLRQHLEEALSGPAHCHTGRVHMLLMSLGVTVWRDRFDLPPLEALADSLGIGLFTSKMTTPNQSAEFRVQIGNGQNVVDFLPNMFTSISGEHYLVENFPDGWSLSELASYFAASHVLSMLVRYYPSRWARLANHEKGDRLMPVLERMRSLIQSEFVRLAMWALEAPDGASEARGAGT